MLSNTTNAEKIRTYYIQLESLVGQYKDYTFSHFII